MKMGKARALLLAAAAMMSCGKGGGGAVTQDGGPGGQTNLVVSWTLAGAAAGSDACMAQGAAQIYVNLSGTIDPTLHESTTVECSLGSVTFSALAIDKLGEPYLEGTLLDAQGTSLAIVGVNVVPQVGATDVSLAFFSPQGTGGGGTTAAASSSSGGTSASTAAASSSSGGTSASTTAASSSSGGTSAASTTSSSSGNPDAGDGG